MKKNTNKKVSIVMGSQSDYKTMQLAEKTLKQLGISVEIKIVSAHRTPKRMYDFALKAEKNNIGFTNDFDYNYDDEELKRFFAPEFRNRIDGVITFGKLDKGTMMKIVGKFLFALRKQVEAKKITISIDDDALDWLVDKGYDPKMGARPLQRLIDKEIKKPLSKAMLFGDLIKGGKCKIILNGQSLDIKVEEEYVAAY